MGPARIWWLSSVAYRRRWFKYARLLKGINFVIFNAILPYEAEFHDDITLEHCALGVVIHPNVRIGKRVRIYHNVTLAAESADGSPMKIVVEDGVLIGAGAIVIARSDAGLTIGKGAIIGAGAVVTRDVAAGQTVVGPAARPLQKN